MAGLFDDLIPASPPKRSLFAVANDMVIEGANAIAGAAGSAANMVAPGNRFSQAVDEFVQSGEESQSDAAKLSKRQFRENVANADGVMGELGAVGRYVTDAPLLALSQAAGSFALPGFAVTGAGALAGQGARLVGASRSAQAAAASRAGLAGGAAAGGMMAGGDAAGTAYELVLRAGGTEEEAQAAAREASLLPAAIGAAGGLVGAERILAGAGGVPRGSLMSRALKTGLIEGGQEAVEEGVTQYEGQRVAVPFDPSIDPGKGVAAAAGMGFALGAPVGAATGAIDAYRNPSPPPKPRDNGAEAARKLAAADNVGDMAAAATELAMTPLTPQRADAAMTAFETRAADDQADIKQQGRMDRTGLPPLPAREQGPGQQPSATVTDTPFGDRVLTLREQLADPQVRQSIREQFGDEALGTVAYYATIADDTTKPMPDKTRDRLLGLAEGIVSRALLRPVGRAGIDSRPGAAGQIGRAGAAPQIGLDTAPTGRMRVNADGTAAPETRADVINDRQRAAERPDGFEQQVQGRPLPRDFTMVGEGELTAPRRPERAAQPVLLLTRDNQPYGTMSAATIRARKEGGEVVEVPGGWAVRKETTDADAADPGRNGVPGPADAGRGNRDPELRQQQRGDVAVDAAAPDAQGMGGVAPDAVRPGERAAPDDALTTLKARWADAVQAGDTEGAARINEQIVAAKARRQVAPSGLRVIVGDKAYPVDSFKQASELSFKAAKEAENRTGEAQFKGQPPIIDADGNVVAHIGVGHMIVRGPPVADGNPPREKILYDPVDEIRADMAAKAKAQEERTVENAPTPKLAAPAANDGDLLGDFLASYDSPQEAGSARKALATTVTWKDGLKGDLSAHILNEYRKGARVVLAASGPAFVHGDMRGWSKRDIGDYGMQFANWLSSHDADAAPTPTAPPTAEPLKARLERARKKPAQPEATAQAEQAAAPKTKRPPKSFRKKVKVTTDAFVEESGKFEQRETDADAALTALDEDIAELEAFRRCITGS